MFPYTNPLIDCMDNACRMRVEVKLGLVVHLIFWGPNKGNKLRFSN